MTGSLPSNVVDLDEYRRMRVAEETWPPDPLTVREYWKGRKGKVLPVYTKSKGPNDAA